ncbi:MAG: peptide chain release factor N(5)-glutamine methyltransferase [Bacteroidota bacterium]
MTNSKKLFNELVSRVRTDDSRDEIFSIVYLLLEDRFGLSKVDIMMGKEIGPVSPDDFTEIIKRINQQEPIQYILGKASFYGRQFFVNPSVLIPRPETELLVESVIKENVSSPAILDIGTGSGCIAISLAIELPLSKVCGIDISEDALSIAHRNAKNLNANINFFKVDILSDVEIDQRFDIIVSNPPYVLLSEKNEIKSNVVDFEPHIALFVEEADPLIFYKAIAKKGKSWLKSHGIIFVEINERYGQAVVDVFKNEGYDHLAVQKDLDGKDRVVMAQLIRGNQ